MTSIIYIGMDVHTTNYTMCAYTIAGGKPFGQTTLKPEAKEIERYLTRLDETLGGGSEFLCRYEAGCLGYSLYHQLTALGSNCVILAPSTNIGQSQKRKEKNGQTGRNQNCEMSSIRNIQHGLCTNGGGQCGKGIYPHERRRQNDVEADEAADPRILHTPWKTVWWKVILNG